MRHMTTVKMMNFSITMATDLVSCEVLRLEENTEAEDLQKAIMSIWGIPTTLFCLLRQMTTPKTLRGTGLLLV
jgi:hypothetical protein